MAPIRMDTSLDNERVLWFSSVLQTIVQQNIRDVQVT